MAAFTQEDIKTAFAGCSPTDWLYIAEGALNVALRYGGENETLKGYVLRIRKDNAEASGGKQDENPWEESMRFTNKMIVPLLGRRYVQPALEVDLKDGFMASLAAHVEPSRPEKRRKFSFDLNLKTGLLMIDNTLLPFGEGPSICFEMKIKWGFLPSDCPFVTHAVKKRVDRFTMHQFYKNQHGELDSYSRYCPLDLFSYDMTRVRTALEALVETPQNNFRMFVDGEMVYPDSKGHGSREKFEEIVKGYPAIKSVDSLLDSFCHLFTREPLLDRIRTVQQMDDCDIEAAWPTYEKILQRGETVLPLADGETLMPRAPPKELPATPEEEHELVRRFMLSCTAKDCSVMIVAKPVQPSTGEEVTELPSYRANPVELEGGRTVVKDLALGYMYSIAVVDLDPKPIEKMHHYFKLDKKIAETYAQAESQGNLP